jgi:hypothetical protein
MRAPAETADSISLSSCVSTSADKPSVSQSSKYRAMVRVSSSAQISSTASAPISRA